MIKRVLLVLILSFFMAFTASASQIEVEAEDSLEWHREKNMYLAKGNARAIQDDKSILADYLYAYYKENEDKEIDIWKIEAKSNVLITNGQTKIVGDNGIYDIYKQEFVVTGKEIGSESENVIVYHDGNQIHSDVLISKMEEGDFGKAEVSELFAIGNVKIITPTDKITGDEGYYNTKKEVAEVEGNVILAKENSVITGEKAIINMKTGIAKMLSTGNGDRVKAIFVTEGKNE